MLLNYIRSQSARLVSDRFFLLSDAVQILEKEQISSNFL
jgi:hypothetical protein